MHVACKSKTSAAGAVDGSKVKASARHHISACWSWCLDKAVLAQGGLAIFERGVY